jgi:chromate reductase
MQLLLLCGSLRHGSTNEAVLRTAALLHGDGAVLYDGLADLPPFNPDADHDPLPSSVIALREAIADADALLICTPEYAGDLPGSFKNLLDWTVGGIETEGKPVAWINASTSGAEGTHRALRTVLSYTGCKVIEDACVNAPTLRTSVEDGVVTDPDVRAAIAASLDALRR